jgi:hypothetical protein
VSRLERGRLLGMPLRTAERLLEALGASVEVTARWEGERLDRLLDAEHARLQQYLAAVLAGLGWAVEVEVSFNHYGDRGRVDVAAMHRPTRTLVIAEVKTAFGDLQDTLGRLDVKARLGRVITERLGWERPVATIPMLVVLEGRTARRVVERHPALFTRYALRGRSAISWLRRPVGRPRPSGLLWFVSLPDAHGATVRRAQRVRIRQDRR